MEINEAFEGNSESYSMQSQWLQTTISCVNDKMKTIINLLEENKISTHNTEEVNKSTKDEITKMINEICTSYCTLAHDYDNLINCTKHKDNVPAFWDDSPFDVIDSNPESIVEDSEHDNEDPGPDTLDPEDETLLSSKDDSRVKQDKAWWKNGGMKVKFNRLFEENTELQMELVRRNSEKREMICKLQEQVARLVAEKEMLKRHLSYVERHKTRFENTSPGRKSNRFDRFFRCSF
ncbi:hypothetical protein vseg_019647 [Gypsophila vaccaria]